ncbi:hypothetical protein ABZ946_34585 [Streptomyces sp. NPDC046324]|uniref:hypothetical protein n=1 Tax=Streptomyces sp. NPDC046324 TaxID=3154915 RepID=UPI0033C2531B
MSSVRVSTALRAVLLLVLALVCAGLPLTPVGSATQLHRSCTHHVAPAAAFESAHAGGGEADIPSGSVLHRDRRRPVSATAGLPGPPLVARAAPVADPPAGSPGGTDTRPRPLAPHDSSALQVFRC